MKKLITLHFVILCSLLNAQNWSPILVNEKMNYRHSDSSIITNTIWVDSMETVGSDVIYHLNRIVKNVPDNPEIVFRNQPQFLLKQMTKQEAGIYIFDYPNEFNIKALASYGETWVFDDQMNITAEVTTLSMEDVFGVQDSVKVISLSDGNEIRLSKSFGILKFPDFENYDYYELVGIQNTNYGESVPDFWDIFDFEVGDVFQTYSYYNDAGNYEIIEEWNKITINTKEVFIDHYMYNIYKVKHEIYYGYGGYISNTHGTNIYDKSYYPGDFPQANKFKNDFLFLFGSYGCSPNYLDPSIYTRIKVFTDQNGLINKQYGTLATEYAGYEELFYPNTPLNDTFNVLFDGECLAYTPHGIRYTESLGNTFTYYCDHFEVYSYSYLMGYVKNGDTVGTIYPDSLLLVGTDLQKAYPNSNVFVYPNPADKVVYYQFKELNNTTEKILIEIRNLQGQVLIQQEGMKTETIALDVESLARGIYFYTIKNSEMLIQQGKLVIQ
jgi:hypothetical protein